MRVAITGASGFLGRYLGQYLDQHGKQSIGLLRNPESDFPYDYRLIGPDADATAYEDSFNDCDAVVHLAAQAHVSPGSSESDRARVVKTNVDLVETVLRSAIKARAKKFIFISSVKVYGETTGVQPFRHDSTHRPVDLYGRSKHEAENRIRALTRDTDLKPTIIQPPLIYGYGVKGNLKTLLKAMQSGIPLPFASIDNRRDIVGLPVICDLIDTCLDSARADHQTFLVSDNQTRSTADIIRLLGRIHRVRAKMFAIPVPLLKIMFRIPGLNSAGDRLLGDLRIDISHTMNQLDWHPITFDPATLKSDYP